MSSIKHVVVAAFHHKKGAIIEYSYPEISQNDLETKYKFLAQMALPDGAHNFTQDVSYLLLNSSEYAISYYRQINKSELKVITDDVTRNTVQKAVVIIAEKTKQNNFQFGYLSKKLQIISKVYFEEKDFSHTNVLETLYNQIVESSRENKALDKGLFGISVRKLVQTLRHDVLKLFKLLLLEKRIIVIGEKSQQVGNAILALASLFPDLLTSHVLKFNDDKNAVYFDATVPKVEENLPKIDNDQNEEIDEKPMTITPHEFENNLGIRENSNEFDKPAPKRQFEVQDLENDKEIEFSSLGHPLAIFTHGNFILPYTCLADIAKLEKTSKSRIGYIIGTTNDLYRVKWKNFADVLVDLNKNSVEIKSSILKYQVALSNADLRFVDKIVDTSGSASVLKKCDNNLDGNNLIEDDNSPITWEGSDDWIREEFKNYLNNFLAVSKYDFNPELVSDYNPDFLQSWKSNTVNSKIWEKLEKPDLINIKPVHPCHQEVLTAEDVSTATEALNFTTKFIEKEFSDATLKLKYTLKSTTSGRKIEQTVENLNKTTTDSIKTAAQFSNKTISSTLNSIKKLPAYTEPLVSNITSGKITEDIAHYTSDAAENAIISASDIAGKTSKNLISAANTSSKWLSSQIGFLGTKIGEMATTVENKTEGDGDSANKRKSSSFGLQSTFSFASSLGSNITSNIGSLSNTIGLTNKVDEKTEENVFEDEKPKDDN